MKRLIFWCLFPLLCAALQGTVTVGASQVIRNVRFAQIGRRTLEADLYLPDKKSRPPLIVWVHGGAWRGGSKNGMPIGKLVDDGYAIVSVDYRLSMEAKFPAQIHDIKAAIRFLRTHGEEWHLATAQIVVAGGHLAALPGVSNGMAELEDKVGDIFLRPMKVILSSDIMDAFGIRTFGQASDVPEFSESPGRQ